MISLLKGEKVNLTKREKVNLIKSDRGLGEIKVTLNWNRKVATRGLMKLFGPRNIDLNLGCLYELKDGTKGGIQAIDKYFGSYTNFPYVQLDIDDRTGETLRINGDKADKIKRILIYCSVYSGVVNWRETDATVTVSYKGAEVIVLKIDNFDTWSRSCAFALVENIDGKALSITKLTQLCKDNRDMDDRYSWGLSWE